MKKTATLILVMLTLALTACNSPSDEPPSDATSSAPDAGPVRQLDRETVSGWSITDEWRVDSADEENGDALTVTGGAGSEAYNTSFTLRDAWDLSATIDLSGGAQEAGFALGTLDLVGISQILLTVDGENAVLTVAYLAGGGFNELLRTDPFAVNGPVTLNVSKLAEDRNLAVSVYSGDIELYSGVAEEIPSTFMRLMNRAGLAGKGSAAFTGVKVVTYSVDGGTETAIEAIDPGPHEDSSDYIFDYAVRNVVNGEERLIIDNAQEGFVWYIGEEFSGDWTAKARVQIGNWNGGDTGVARFSFGGELIDNDDFDFQVPDQYGMFTVRLDGNNNLYFENAQQLRNDSWSTKAGGTTWVPIGYPIFDMIASYKTGTDILNIQFIDLNGDIAHTIHTRPYDEGYLDGTKYFSFFVWQSQIQITNMEFINEYTELTEPEAAPPEGSSLGDYKPYSDFGPTENTADWVFEGGDHKFRSTDGGNALGIDGLGLGDSARAQYEGTLSGDWSIDTVLRFESTTGNYTGRIYFFDDDWALKGIITANMNGDGEAWMMAQMLSGDWVTLFDSEPAPLPTGDIHLSVGKKADGQTLVIRAVNEQGIEIFYGETSDMTNISEVTRFSFVAQETRMVFDNIVVGTNGDSIVSIGAPVAGFGDGKNSSVWTLNGDVFVKAGSREGEALLFNSDLETTAVAALGNAFTLSMDIMYDITHTGRFVTRFFMYSDDELRGIVDFESAFNEHFQISAQKHENDEWGDLASSGGWQPMIGRSATLTISRPAGTNKLRISAVDFAGNTLFDQETAEFDSDPGINRIEIHGFQTVTVLDNVVIR